MKKYMAVIAALMIGLNSSSLEMTALAGQIEDGQDAGSELSDLKEEQPEALEDDEKDTTDGERSDLASLLLPEKLGVVLDPWEMDGKGQIYSEEYTIQNVGEAPGTLVLSFACKPMENSGVIVRQEKEGLNEDESKSLYMKIVFGNDEQLILSEEFSEYLIEIEPGEELSVCFQGELNENAAEPWKDGDIEVEGVYSWKTEGEASADEKEDDPLAPNIEKEKAQSVVSGENGSDSSLEAEKEKTQKKEIQKEEASLTDKDFHEDGKSPDNEELQDEKDSLENDIDQEDRREIIELNETQEWKVVLNSWKEGENEESVFGQYLLRNSGESAGRLVLSDIIWKDIKENDEGTNVVDQEEILSSSESDPKFSLVYAYMVVGNEEKVALRQENVGFEVELKPGEEMTVDFLGENRKGMELGGGFGEITAVYSWNEE